MKRCHVLNRFLLPIALVTLAGVGDLPPKSARLILRIYPVVGAVAKWETPGAFSKQA